MSGEPGPNGAWRTAIARSEDGRLWIRGYDITSLMKQRTFADTVYLLHRSRLPDGRERALMDAILVASADHGSGAPSCAAARLVASGNRQSLSAAVAAGVLAIGNEHGGAGLACMEMIAACVERAQRESITLAEVAARTVEEVRAAGKRVPGLGHRVHSHDPRSDALFDMARGFELSGSGIALMEALERSLREKVKPLPINVDGAIAAVLHDLGFEPAFGQLAFLIGRVAGIAAEVAEEHAREKAMRIHIPVEYDGPPPRPIE